MRFALYLVSTMVLTACSTLTSQGTAAIDETARAVVAPIVAAQVPGPIGEALTTCIVTHATTEELIEIAAASIGSPSPDIVLLVSDVLARPETVECATQSLSGA